MVWVFGDFLFYFVDYILVFYFLSLSVSPASSVCVHLCFIYSSVYLSLSFPALSVYLFPLISSVYRAFSVHSYIIHLCA